MKTKILLSVALLSMAVAMPASANWFNNPHLGISRNVGSAPNPTPEDVRLMRMPTVSPRAESDRPGLFARIGAMFRGERAQPAQTTAQR